MQESISKNIRPPLLDIPLRDHLEVAHLCDLAIDFGQAQIFPTPHGRRMTFIVQGGKVQGPQLRGEVLPGGGDWVLIGSDLVARLDVRVTIRTEDGAHIHMTNTGRVRLTPEASKQFYEGKLLTQDQVFARSAPLFETGAEPYVWLNAVVALAINEISLSRVHYRIYMLQ